MNYEILNVVRIKRFEYVSMHRCKIRIVLLGLDCKLYVMLIYQSNPMHECDSNSIVLIVEQK